jgi:integrase/recombinase XerD
MSTLQQSIINFLQHCRYEKNLSNKTIYFYKLDLNQFVSFIQRNDYPELIAEINKFHLKHYLRDISEWKIKTVKRKVASLKAMFNYLEYEDIISVNPIRRIRITLKEAVSLPKALNKQEVISILEEAYKEISQAPKTKYAYLEKVRNATVVELLFSTGARVSEIANLRVEDLDTKTGAVILKGKGNKERVIQICNDDTITLIDIYTCLFSEKIIASGGFCL